MVANSTQFPSESRRPAETPSRDYAVRLAQPADRPGLLELMEGTVAAAPIGPRHAWLYEKGPDGPTWTWLAQHRATGQILGCTSILPRRFWLDGRQVLGGMGYDAWVRPEQRRKGIVSALHKASREAMRTGEAPFRFMAGPPVVENLEALKKVGSSVVGTLRFLALPLTSEGVSNWLNMSPGMSWAMSRTPGIDTLLAGVRRLVGGVGRPNGLQVRVVDAFGGSFDDLFEAATLRHRVIGRRDAAFLAWRYRDNPVVSQRILAVESGRRVIAWVAVERGPKGWLLVDHLLPADRNLASDALAAVVGFAAMQGASRLSLRINPDNADARTFLGQAFLPGRMRESQQVLCDDPETLGVLSAHSGWHFTSGDLAPEATPWSHATIESPTHPPHLRARSAPTLIPGRARERRRSPAGLRQRVGAARQRVEALQPGLALSSRRLQRPSYWNYVRSMAPALEINGDRLWQTLMELGQVGAYKDERTGLMGVNRLALTDADGEGRRLVKSWFEQAGLKVRVDQVGNVIGRRPGKDESLAPVMSGSHIDSVPTGGAFDGALGVLGALEVVRTLNDRQVETRRPIEIAFFTDEEGARFGTDMLGSAVAVGRLTLERCLALTDKAGLTVGAELERLGFKGSHPVRLPPPHAYVECHIEQGPILRAAEMDLGVVTGVQGISWLELTITGKSAHAGTTPMTMRKDPGLAASMINVRMAAMARSGNFGAEMRATIGRIDPSPDLVNIVPSRVVCTVDLRNPDDAQMANAERELKAYFKTVEAELGVTNRVPADRQDGHGSGSRRMSDGHRTTHGPRGVPAQTTFCRGRSRCAR